MNDIRDNQRIKNLPDDLQEIANEMLEKKFGLSKQGQIVEEKPKRDEQYTQYNPHRDGSVMEEVRWMDKNTIDIHGTLNVRGWLYYIRTDRFYRDFSYDPNRHSFRIIFIGAYSKREYKEDIDDRFTAEVNGPEYIESVKQRLEIIMKEPVGIKGPNAIPRW